MELGILELGVKWGYLAFLILGDVCFWVKNGDLAGHLGQYSLKNMQKCAKMRKNVHEKRRNMHFFAEKCSKSALFCIFLRDTCAFDRRSNASIS